jgi:hypothetical protein
VLKVAARNYLRGHNARAFLLTDIPLLPFGEFRETLLKAIQAQGRLVVLGGQGLAKSRTKLLAAVARDKSGDLLLFSTDVDEEYPSLTPLCPQAQGFERELAEQWGVVPFGHPWFKPLRFHPSNPGRRDAWERDRQQSIAPGSRDFFKCWEPKSTKWPWGPCMPE